jgi:hypothetical protein
MVCAGGAASARTIAHAQASGLTTLNTEYPGAPDGWQWQDDRDAETSSFTSVTVIQDGAQTADPLPVAGNVPNVQDRNLHISSDHSRAATGFGRLPEPSAWVLLLIGLGMIGFALRGLVAANRRLARLEASEEA